MQGDLLALIEAAYSPAATDNEWLGGLIHSAAPSIDRGLGLFAHTYELGGADTVRYPAIYTSSGPATKAFRDAVLNLARSIPEPLVRRGYPRVPAAAFATELAGVPEWRLPVLDPHARDAFGIVGGNLTDRGIVLSALSDAPGHTRPAEARLWTQVAAHLAAGYRLRAAAPAFDAVLSPSGRVEHAEGDAMLAPSRAALGEGARSMDRARGKMRRTEPEEALALWRSLIAGQWTLVEQLDTDGRRYLFARRNAPEVREWRNLTARERQVVAYAAEGHAHKMIAYELGIGISTVASHLKNAAAKLGVKSRFELVRAYKRRPPAAHT